MGLFDKMKKMAGFTGVKIEFTWVESPFPFGDEVIKGNFTVKAGSDVTIVSVTDIFLARFTSGTGDSEQEHEIIISEEMNDGSYDIDKSYPVALKSGETFEGGICLLDVFAEKSLREYGIFDAASAKEKGAKFFLKVEVDIKETAGLFDPEAEAEVIVQ